MKQLYNTLKLCITSAFPTWNKYKKKVATTQTKEGISNKVLLKHEEKLFQAAMFVFLFLYDRCGWPN